MFLVSFCYLRILLFAKRSKRRLKDLAKGLFYDQGTRPVSFEVKNDVFQICLILMFLCCR